MARRSAGSTSRAAEGVVGPHVHVSGWALAATRHSRGRSAPRRPRVSCAIRPAARRRRGGASRAIPTIRTAVSSSPATFAPIRPRRGSTGARFASSPSRATAAKRCSGADRSIEASAHARWRFSRRRGVDSPSIVLPALSGVAAGGAFALDHWYTAYVSATTRIGMRVPILYLRTTTGAGDDYRFDPDFDVAPAAGDARGRRRFAVAGARASRSTRTCRSSSR